MLLELTRGKSSAKSTIGMLKVDGFFECYTLEDVVRPEKIKGETAIPAGTYKVILNESVRFKRLLPLVLSVPGYEGVRIHPGNTDADTEGCILVGTTCLTDFVGNSRLAFGKLLDKMYKAGSIQLIIK